MINARDIYSLASTAQAAYGTLQLEQTLEKNLATGVDNDPLLSETQAKEFTTEWHIKNLIKTSRSRG